MTSEGASGKIASYVPHYTPVAAAVAALTTTTVAAMREVQMGKYG
jgi:hypothetical protein